MTYVIYFQKYDTKLEELAVNWVKKCVFKHPDKTESEYAKVGQNLAMTAGSAINLNFMLQNWFDEYHDYTYETKECKADKKCGHYTQVNNNFLEIDYNVYQFQTVYFKLQSSQN